MVLIAPTAPSAEAKSDCRVQNATAEKRYRTLDAAVGASRNGDTLVVRGTCRGGLVIKRNITIKAHSRKGSKRSTIHGLGLGSALLIDEGRSVRLVGLAIRGDPDLMLEHSGGGVFVSRAKVTMKDVTISGFSTQGDGGAIYSLNGDVRIAGGSRIRANRADEGGGIAIVSGTLTLDGRAAVEGNTAAWGGGIANRGSVTLGGQSRVRKNQASWGGGIASYENSQVLLHSRSAIVANLATDSGGGLHNHGGVIILNGSSSVRGNHTDGSGGGILSMRGTVTLNGRGSIAGNTAVGPGGGVHSSLGAAAVVLNDLSTVIGNASADAGGGVHSKGSLAFMEEVSVSGNEALQGGGVMRTGGHVGGITCGPGPGANVHGNRPDDCSGIEPDQRVTLAEHGYSMLLPMGWRHGTVEAVAGSVPGGSEPRLPASDVGMELEIRSAPPGRIRCHIWRAPSNEQGLDSFLREWSGAPGYFTRADLKSGRAARYDHRVRDGSESPPSVTYIVEGSQGLAQITCSGVPVPRDRWQSIADGFQFLDDRDG